MKFGPGTGRPPSAPAASRLKPALAAAVISLGMLLALTASGISSFRAQKRYDVRTVVPRRPPPVPAAASKPAPGPAAARSASRSRTEAGPVRASAADSALPSLAGFPAGYDGYCLDLDFSVRSEGSAGFADLSVADVPPSLIARVEPVYPLAAELHGIEGSVRVRFLVDAAGEVGEIEVVSSRPAGVFDRSARAALKQWRFRPALRGGAPVAAWVSLPVTFRLGEDRGR